MVALGLVSMPAEALEAMVAFLRDGPGARAGTVEAQRAAWSRFMDGMDAERPPPSRAALDAAVTPAYALSLRPADELVEEALLRAAAGDALGAARCAYSAVATHRLPGRCVPAVRLREHARATAERCAFGFFAEVGDAARDAVMAEVHRALGGRFVVEPLAAPRLSALGGGAEDTASLAPWKSANSLPLCLDGLPDLALRAADLPTLVCARADDDSLAVALDLRSALEDGAGALVVECLYAPFSPKGPAGFDPDASAAAALVAAAKGRPSAPRVVEGPPLAVRALLSRLDFRRERLAPACAERLRRDGGGGGGDSPRAAALRDGVRAATLSGVRAGAAEAALAEGNALFGLGDRAGALRAWRGGLDAVADAGDADGLRGRLARNAQCPGNPFNFTST